MWVFFFSVSAAFLGDIALDEEDLRAFKVDRIIDVAQRTVHNINRTDPGNKWPVLLKQQKPLLLRRCKISDENTSLADCGEALLLVVLDNVPTNHLFITPNTYYTIIHKGFLLSNTTTASETWLIT